ncbi:hypothetical protein [Pedobacter agri]|uniref:hypothetical protein n=1 Tax=Pedobacter agri TaxID=454586 RepID=UPI00293040F1|nr:hypothetical protein [Pedobacter agri]
MKTIKTILGIAVVLFIGVVFFYTSSSVKTAKEIETTYTHHNQTITLEGKFKAPFLTRTGKNIAMEFEVYNDFFIIQTGNKTINGITVNYGEGKNSVFIDVPEDSRKFEQTDVVIFDKDGNKLTTSDKVKITAQIVYPNKGVKKSSSVKDYSTGKVTVKDEGEDFGYEVSNVVIEKI